MVGNDLHVVCHGEHYYIPQVLRLFTCNRVGRDTELVFFLHRPISFYIAISRRALPKISHIHLAMFSFQYKLLHFMYDIGDFPIYVLTAYSKLPYCTYIVTECLY